MEGSIQGPVFSEQWKERHYWRKLLGMLLSLLSLVLCAWLSMCLCGWVLLWPVSHLQRECIDLKVDRTSSIIFVHIK